MRRMETWVARWLRRRGWVCFYLIPEARQCLTCCWLDMYKREDHAN